MRNIWIDCDPGHDDALAILTAIAHPEIFSILGISTIGGNQTLDKVTKNAQNILAYVKSDIPLLKGQEGPLVKSLTPTDEAHGVSGMDGPYFEQLTYPILEKNPITYMYEKIKSNSEKTTLVALGPLTNIALLLKTYPDIHQKIECISLMGGGLSHGNVTATAEFNIYVDPEAAHIVFHSELPIVMAGLDVTEKAEILVKEINHLEGKGPVSQLAYELLTFYNESGKQFGFINSPIHDLCAVAYLINPTIFEGRNYFVDVDTNEGVGRGQTFADKRRVTQNQPNTYVLEKVDREAFVTILIHSLERLDKEVLLDV